MARAAARFLLGLPQVAAPARVCSMPRLRIAGWKPRNSRNTLSWVSGFNKRAPAGCRIARPTRSEHHDRRHPSPGRPPGHRHAAQVTTAPSGHATRLRPKAPGYDSTRLRRDHHRGRYVWTHEFFGCANWGCAPWCWRRAPAWAARGIGTAIPVHALIPESHLYAHPFSQELLAEWDWGEHFAGPAGDVALPEPCRRQVRPAPQHALPQPGRRGALPGGDAAGHRAR